MASASLKATDDFSADRSTHPRVGLKAMEAKIAQEIYVNAENAITALIAVGGSMPRPSEALSVLTLCFLVMENGFVVVGKSASASPENFDPEKGILFAYEDAIRQLWPLEAYALRDRLTA